jgi:hypothetical protein
MKYRFIEYEKTLYLVLGMGYDRSLECPEYFVCAPLDKDSMSLFRTSLILHTVNISLDKATEITSKNKLLALRVLYG